jgi:feruloyl esterase
MLGAVKARDWYDGRRSANLPAGWSASRTRPLCPYPAVAKYKGSGDPDSADSFRCE